MKEAENQTSALALGRLLVERGVLADDQVEHCLEIQRDLEAMGVRRPLGQILLEQQLVEYEVLSELLAGQRRDLDLLNDFRFGQLAQANGFVSADQVDECLRIQDEADNGDHQRLGEILVDRGHMTSAQRDTVMKVLGRIQRSRTIPPSSGPTLRALPAEGADLPLKFKDDSEAILKEEKRKESGIRKGPTCPHCGGPVRLDQESCGQCRGRLRQPRRTGNPALRKLLLAAAALALIVTGFVGLSLRNKQQAEADRQEAQRLLTDLRRSLKEASRCLEGDRRDRTAARELVKRSADRMQTLRDHLKEKELRAFPIQPEEDELARLHSAVE